MVAGRSGVRSLSTFFAKVRLLLLARLLFDLLRQVGGTINFTNAPGEGFDFFFLNVGEVRVADFFAALSGDVFDLFDF